MKLHNFFLTNQNKILFTVGNCMPLHLPVHQIWEMKLNFTNVLAKIRMIITFDSLSANYLLNFNRCIFVSYNLTLTNSNQTWFAQCFAKYFEILSLKFLSPYDLLLKSYTYFSSSNFSFDFLNIFIRWNHCMISDVFPR